jgi:hypothetical protein
MGNPLIEVPATHGTWHPMSMSDIIAIKTCHRHCQRPLRFLISRLGNAFSLSHVLFVPFVGLHLQILTRET